jgi:hypothetical protein
MSEYDERVKDSLPISGPRKMPILPAKEKKLKAFAWVRAVLFSVIMARIVLGAMHSDDYRKGRFQGRTQQSQQMPQQDTGKESFARSLY